MSRWYVWAPLGLFIFFVGLAGYQLTQPKDELIRSTMIAKPLPEFELEPAYTGLPGASRADFIGGSPRLLNVWASWCLPCITEAPQLEALNEAGVEIIGVAIRDKPEDVERFLSTYGNPYSKIGADPISAIQFELGSSGVPETYVIDAQGVIRHQHIGDIRPEHVSMLIAKLAEVSQ
jgi:cytochrome c biogenesis protein CcmG/thiol:disulfide interchange protein DsbE